MASWYEGGASKSGERAGSASSHKTRSNGCRLKDDFASCTSYSKD